MHHPARRHRHAHAAAILLLIVSVASIAFAQAEKDPSPHSEAQLVSEVTSVKPGEPFWVGLRLTMDKGWHSYWQNPGDSGQATAVKWQLPQGLQASEIVWPFPERIEFPPLVSYGYHDEVLLPIQITPSAQISVGSTVELKGKAEWLICADVCLPAQQNVSLSVPVRAETPKPDAQWQSAFASTRARIPQAVPAAKMTAAATPEGYQLTIQGVRTPGKGIHFFALDQAIIAHAAEQPVSKSGRGLKIGLAKSEYANGATSRLRGVLVAPEGSGWDPAGRVRAMLVDVPVEGGTEPLAASQTSQAQPAPSSPIGTGSTSSRESDTTRPTLLFAALLAFVGGLILNLMPCVFPVLSLKILGFVQHAGHDRAKVRAHGTFFALGVIASFLALAALLLILRQGGNELGWGFQLQSPVIVAFMALLFVTIGLNLLGAFEVGLGLTRLASVGTGSGYGSAFLTGVLATVCATPCTAPFMGSALGFALTQPATVSLLIFFMLGLGMATPYIVLSFFPALVEKLPQPGRWMETFKQLLAFPMFATSVWLVWVFGLQTGVDSVTRLLAATVLLSFGLWLLGRWQTGRARAVARVLATAAAVFALVLAVNSARTPAPQQSPVASNGQGTWATYSPDAVEQLRASGQPVFIDFTAAWCLTCQVNERVALETDEVRQAFAERNVALVKADWTRRDPVITRALEHYGRSGVPVYVLYHPGSDKPVLLPEVLTKSIVLDALAKLPAAPVAKRSEAGSATTSSR